MAYICNIMIIMIWTCMSKNCILMYIDLKYMAFVGPTSVISTTNSDKASCTSEFLRSNLIMVRM